MAQLRTYGNLNLLYEGNKECFMAIKTPSGQTDRIKLKEIVMQGSIWGPLCCTTTMDKVGQKVYKTRKSLYTYKAYQIKSRVSETSH